MSCDARPSSVIDGNLTALAEASRDVVCIADANRVLLLNAAGRALLGVDSAEHAAAPLTAYLVAADRAAAEAVIAAAVRTQLPRDVTLRFRHQQTGDDVEAACVVTALRVPPGCGEAVAIVGRCDGARPPAPFDDLSARARLMELLIGVVGHDLRNPLNAIITCAHLVAKQSEMPGAKSAMSRIIASGQRMQRMIDQLLDLTRIRSGGIPLRPARVDAGALAGQAARETLTAHPDWQISVEVRGDTTLSGDPDRIQQMLSNLLGNAVQHGTRDAGIRVDVDGGDADAVQVSIWNAGAIPPELLPVLFNPFRVVHHKRSNSNGLGLGLYVTRQIALAHGGDVSAMSDHGGTRIIARLRRSGAGAHEGPARDPHDEIAAMAAIADGTSPTAVTARLFGSAPLHERAPQQYRDLFERYGRALDAALDRQTYRDVPGDVTGDLRAMAERLAELGAGAREVAELHARALRQRTRGVVFPRAQAYATEGRLVSFELMGHLLSVYRRKAAFGAGDRQHG